MRTRALIAMVVFSLFVSPEQVSPLSSPQRPGEVARTGVPRDPSAVGYLNLHRRHPDGAEGPVEFATDYHIAVALQRLSPIESFLESFARLTDGVRGKLTPSELSVIGNTDSEIQTIGFHNIPLIVEGTLRKQEYQLRQVEYELAQLRHAHGKIAEEELDRAKRAYAEATKRFQTFWDKKLPID